MDVSNTSSDWIRLVSPVGPQEVSSCCLDFFKSVSHLHLVFVVLSISQGRLHPWGLWNRCPTRWRDQSGCLVITTCNRDEHHWILSNRSRLSSVITLLPAVHDTYSTNCLCNPYCATLFRCTGRDDSQRQQFDHPVASGNCTCAVHGCGHSIYSKFEVTIRSGTRQCDAFGMEHERAFPAIKSVSSTVLGCLAISCSRMRCLECVYWINDRRECLGAYPSRWMILTWSWW